MSLLDDRSDLIKRLLIFKSKSRLTYKAIANQMKKNKVWVTSLFFGKNRCSAQDANLLLKTLNSHDCAVVEALQTVPDRSADHNISSDPVVYRLIELINVYGPALKALIQEEFGDGIMSAIDCKLYLDRKSDPNGDRVVITIDGKFLPYYNGN